MDYPKRSGKWEGKESSPEVWPRPAHLSLVGEASQETLPLTPVQDLQLFVVDAVLLPDILSRVQRRPFLVHAELSTATAALGMKFRCLYSKLICKANVPTQLIDLMP